MFNDKEEYIVKAKKENIEINGPKYEIKDRISFYILFICTAILCFILSKILIGFIIIVIGALLIAFSYSKWNLRIEDETIFIKKGFINYTIEFKDLIRVMRTTYTESSTTSYSTEHNLKIEYLNNNHYDIINLPFSPQNMETEISEVCRLFVTNKQLEKYPDSYNDYIDIK